MTAIAGYTKSCGKNLGGGVTIYITEMSNITSFTKGTGVESYSTMTLLSSKKFWQYSFEQDSAQRTCNVETLKGAFKVTNQVIFDMGKVDLAARNALQLLLDNNDCGYCVIFEDSNSVKWVLGYDELDQKERFAKVMSMVIDSKQDFADAPTQIITFQSIQRELPRTFTGTVDETA